jgi:hypothetical protein
MPVPVNAWTRPAAGVSNVSFRALKSANYRARVSLAMLGNLMVAKIRARQINRPAVARGFVRSFHIRLKL